MIESDKFFQQSHLLHIISHGCAHCAFSCQIRLSMEAHSVMESKDNYIFEILVYQQTEYLFESIIWNDYKTKGERSVVVMQLILILITHKPLCVSSGSALAIHRKTTMWHSKGHIISCKQRLLCFLCGFVNDGHFDRKRRAFRKLRSCLHLKVTTAFCIAPYFIASDAVAVFKSRIGMIQNTTSLILLKDGT